MRHFTKAASVTPSDTDELTNQGRLYIGGAGSGGLKVVTSEGSTVTFAGVTVGWFGDLRVKQVFNTGTDVTNIVVAYE